MSAAATVAAEKPTVRPAVAIVARDRVRVAPRARELLAVARDEEQRVVDREAQPEADHEVQREDAEAEDLVDQREDEEGPEHGGRSRPRGAAASRGRGRTAGRARAGTGTRSARRGRGPRSPSRRSGAPRPRARRRSRPACPANASSAAWPTSSPSAEAASCAVTSPGRGDIGRGDAGDLREPLARPRPCPRARPRAGRRPRPGRGPWRPGCARIATSESAPGATKPPELSSAPASGPPITPARTTNSATMRSVRRGRVAGMPTMVRRARAAAHRLRGGNRRRARTPAGVRSAAMQNPDLGPTDLSAGWECFERADWTGARDLFAARLAAAPGDAEALDGLGQALWWLGDRDAGIAHRREAYLAYRRDGEALPAGRIATYLAGEHRIDGRTAASAGWLARARRLLEEGGPSAERGALAVEEAKRAADPADAERHARAALAIAHEMGDPGVECTALAQLGHALVRQDRVAEGTAALDEAMTVALGGESRDSFANSDACCTTLVVCERLADLRRATEWCELVVEYGEQRSFTPVQSWCRGVFAHVLVRAGDWERAEDGAARDARASRRATPRQEPREAARGARRAAPAPGPSRGGRAARRRHGAAAPRAAGARRAPARARRARPCGRAARRAGPRRRRPGAARGPRRARARRGDRDGRSPARRGSARCPAGRSSTPRAACSPGRRASRRWRRPSRRSPRSPMRTPIVVCAAGRGEVLEIGFGAGHDGAGSPKTLGASSLGVAVSP